MAGRCSLTAGPPRESSIQCNLGATKTQLDRSNEIMGNRRLMLLLTLVLMLKGQCNAQELEISEEEYRTDVEAKHVPPRKFDEGHHGHAENTNHITAAELDGLASLLRNQYELSSNLDDSTRDELDKDLSALTDDEGEEQQQQEEEDNKT